MVDCEHVLFHQCLRKQNNARIVTNRNMYVLSYTYYSVTSIYQYTGIIVYLFHTDRLIDVLYMYYYLI